MIFNRAVQLWDEQVKQAIREWPGAHARCSWSKTTAGWEEYAIARKCNETDGKKKRVIWKDVVDRTNEDFGGGMKQMLVGIQGIPDYQAGEADTVSSSEEQIR